jgi:hypothetical protein
MFQNTPLVKPQETMREWNWMGCIAYGHATDVNLLKENTNITNWKDTLLDSSKEFDVKVHKAKTRRIFMFRQQNAT